MSGAAQGPVGRWLSRPDWSDVADASGYIGSVGLLPIKSFAELQLNWTAFLTMGGYATCCAGLFRLRRHEKFTRTPVAIGGSRRSNLCAAAVLLAGAPRGTSWA